MAHQSLAWVFRTEFDRNQSTLLSPLHKEVNKCYFFKDL